MVETEPVDGPAAVADVESGWAGAADRETTSVVGELELDRLRRAHPSTALVSQARWMCFGHENDAVVSVAWLWLLGSRYVAAAVARRDAEASGNPSEPPTVL